MKCLDEASNSIYMLLDRSSKRDMPLLSKANDILCSIPKIGLLTATTIVTGVGGFSAFSKPEKLAAYFEI